MSWATSSSLRNFFGSFLILFGMALAGHSADASQLCDTAKIDNDVYWHDHLGHDSFDSKYRSPFGAVRTDQGTVLLRFRTCYNDVQKVMLRTYLLVNKEERWYEMRKDHVEYDSELGQVQYWVFEAPVPTYPTLLYYFFQAIDGSRTAQYGVKNPSTHSGGWGSFTYTPVPHNYQLTVYDKGFEVANWLRGAVIYQIFPDRFRNGNHSNDPVTGQGFSYGATRRLHDWNEPICDPNNDDDHSPCARQPDSQFYGGDLEGVTEKLDYLSSLGVNAIYLNPIFDSATNHHYDTRNYYDVDTPLGGMPAYDRLVTEATKRGIRLILDGAFNDVSADNPLFDLYGRQPGVGACESESSPYRDWFLIPYRNEYNRARDNTGRTGRLAFCPGQPPGTPGPGGHDGLSYEAWAGYFELPFLNWGSWSVRDYFYGSKDRVAGFWIKKGASGWRLDVAGLIDRGRAWQDHNGVWEGFRRVVKSVDPDAVMIGEEWGNASYWLLGDEWDSAMNYRFRTTVINWLFDGCQGAGCKNNGNAFEDLNFNDGSAGNFGGPLSKISQTDFDARLRSIQEHYPPQVWQSMMNLVGSHDTSRISFLLKKISRDDQVLARRKQYLLALFQMTYPGAPTIYYGDEAGVISDDQWHGGRYLVDPYTRPPYPWRDEGLNPDDNLTAHYQKLGKIRNSISALKAGEYQPLFTHDLKQLFAFKRSDRNYDVFVVLNRDSYQTQQTDMKVPLPDGTVLKDVLNGDSITVSGGMVNTGPIPSLWGKVLVVSKRGH